MLAKSPTNPLARSANRRKGGKQATWGDKAKVTFGNVLEIPFVCKIVSYLALDGNVAIIGPEWGAVKSKDFGSRSSTRPADEDQTPRPATR